MFRKVKNEKGSLEKYLLKQEGVNVSVNLVLAAALIEYEGSLGFYENDSIEKNFDNGKKIWILFAVLGEF